LLDQGAARPSPALGKRWRDSTTERERRRPLPQPLPEAGRGQIFDEKEKAFPTPHRASGSPSPLRGGGWGEGSSSQPERAVVGAAPDRAEATASSGRSLRPALLLTSWPAHRPGSRPRP